MVGRTNLEWPNGGTFYVLFLLNLPQCELLELMRYGNKRSWVLFHSFSLNSQGV